MKKSFILISILIIGVVYFICSRAMIFSYMNPYTNTEGYSYISKAAYELGKGLNYAQAASKKEGYNYKYLFWNAYGSGFLKHNPIPNDLDYAIGIDLGEYDYDGKNSAEIADNVINKIQNFQYNFNLYINTAEPKYFYSSWGVLDPLSRSYFDKDEYKQSFSANLDKALSGEKYIHYTTKFYNDEDSNQERELNLPYLMRPYELLLEEYKPFIFYSDLVAYNSHMPRYVREVSIAPEFYVTINHNGKKQKIELVPELYTGARLQFSRRVFASNTFIGKDAVKFLNNIDVMNNDEEYYFYRFFSYRRLLLEVENIAAQNERAVKLFKRIMQSANIIYPLLSEEEFNEIENFVEDNLSSKDLQLLNEFINISKNTVRMVTVPDLYTQLYADGHIQKMYSLLGTIIDDIENANIFDEKNLSEIKTFYKNDFKLVLTPDKLINSEEETKKLGDKYDAIELMLNKTIDTKTVHREKQEKIIKRLNTVLTDAGYHKVCVCWLNKTTAGIIEDEFTKTIPDLRKFAVENDLADINYVLLKPEQLPITQLQYDVWARYNPTPEEEERYQNIRKILKEDRKNFYVRKKLIFSFN